MEVIIVAITSYLMGSIPFGFILTKIFLKKDIRGIGSGNIGATNALRTGNKSLGYGTLLLDILKAIIPVIYTKLNYPDYIFITSMFVFLGHVFPLWLKFKGGKGVAPYVGILFSINDLAVETVSGQFCGSPGPLLITTPFGSCFKISSILVSHGTLTTL